ncbi:MAG: alpha-amylase family glycosyl hydrolase, partial [Bellilinea sp.]
WSVTDQKYRDARIIFLDFEKSNWTFDPLRGEYFWHRFYHHQPDLNYDNPEVQKAMMRVIQFWIDQGADAIRVDAPPYLIEREGTNCENLPETHAYYKRLRKFVEAYAPDTMLLAEANQWPEDTREYFGDGDEFHMNFHFPLMPRLFMALAKADRTPIEQILARTPELPENCQWGIFLRCHDELTLEMVTPEERQFMWDYYAPQPEMRINLGIRRRLAPLLDNDPRRIRLLHSILLSFIGSPVMYYGDEIGMGDNINLPDRDGLRTPMQWDDSPNGGFSKADASRLRLPVIDDPVFGYRKVNVAAAEADPGSLLNWLRNMIRIRKQHPVFGAGRLTMLAPANKQILAYLRDDGDARVLVVANLSAETQKIGVNGLIGLTSRWSDLINGRMFQTNQDIQLEPYGFHWLLPD